MVVGIPLNNLKEKEKVDFDSPVSERNGYRVPLAISGLPSNTNFYKTVGSFTQLTSNSAFGFINQSGVTPKLPKCSTKTLKIGKWTPKLSKKSSKSVSNLQEAKKSSVTRLRSSKALLEP